MSDVTEPRLCRGETVCRVVEFHNGKRHRVLATAIDGILIDGIDAIVETFNHDDYMAVYGAQFRICDRVRDDGKIVPGAVRFDILFAPEPVSDEVGPKFVKARLEAIDTLFCELMGFARKTGNERFGEDVDEAYWAFAHLVSRVRKYEESLT